MFGAFAFAQPYFAAGNTLVSLLLPAPTQGASTARLLAGTNGGTLSRILSPTTPNTSPQLLPPTNPKVND